jgi:hypothetical protein
VIAQRVLNGHSILALHAAHITFCFALAFTRAGRHRANSPKLDMRRGEARRTMIATFAILPYISSNTLLARVSAR